MTPILQNFGKKIVYDTCNVWKSVAIIRNLLHTFAHWRLFVATDIFYRLETSWQLAFVEKHSSYLLETRKSLNDFTKCLWQSWRLSFRLMPFKPSVSSMAHIGWTFCRLLLKHTMVALHNCIVVGRLAIASHRRLRLQVPITWTSNFETSMNFFDLRCYCLHRWNVVTSRGLADVRTSKFEIWREHSIWSWC